MPKTFTQDEVNSIVEDRLARERRGSPRVEAVEPRRVYTPTSGNSFYADIFRAAQHDEAAQRRKAEYALEVVGEINLGSREGRYAETCIRESFRHGDKDVHSRKFAEAMREVRALGTGVPTGLQIGTPTPPQGAAFVTPFILNKLWAPYRGRRRPFADQCMPFPLPAYGMHGYIPAFTSATGAGLQTEGTAVSELVPSTGLEGNEVQLAAGRLTLDQQFFDRAFGQGVHVDVLVGLQMLNQIEEQVDQHVLVQAAAGKAVAGSGETWVTEPEKVWEETKWKEVIQGFIRFYEDLAKGREQMLDEAGTRIRPTHFFTTSDFYSFVTRLTDKSGRPILTPVQVQVPDYIPASGADHDLGDHTVELPKWSRFTGTVLPGGLAWFTDDNISAIGTTSRTPLYASAPDEGIVLMEDPATTLSIFPETVANELKVVLIERKYVCAVIRRPAATVVISGNAYTTARK